VSLSRRYNKSAQQWVRVGIGCNSSIATVCTIALSVANTHGALSMQCCYWSAGTFDFFLLLLCNEQYRKCSFSTELGKVVGPGKCCCTVS
jgi:hypothetical protein